MHLDVHGQPIVDEALSDLLEALAAGLNHALLVHGPVGSGKTRLSEIAAQQASARGFSLHRPPADPPYSPSPGQPTLVIVDDADRLPPITFAEQAPSTSGPVGLLMTVRNPNARPELGRFFEPVAPTPVSVRLESLSRSAAAQMITDLLGDPPDDALLRWALLAEGDPGMIQAAIHGLKEEERLERHAGRVRFAAPAGADVPIPHRVMAAAQLRLAGLSSPCRQLVSIAAALGPSIEPARLAALLGRTTAQLLPWWEEALNEGILRQHENRLLFAHELLREAVAEQIPTALRTVLSDHSIDERMIEAPTGDGLTGTLWGIEDLADEPGGERVASPNRLTLRERRVLSLLARGRSNQQISRALGISVHAVKRHVSNLLIKFDCSNRTEVALIATRLASTGPTRAAIPIHPCGDRYDADDATA